MKRLLMSACPSLRATMLENMNGLYSRDIFTKSASITLLFVTIAVPLYLYVRCFKLHTSHLHNLVPREAPTSHPLSMLGKAQFTVKEIPTNYIEDGSAQKRRSSSPSFKLGGDAATPRTNGCKTIQRGREPS